MKAHGKRRWNSAPSDIHGNGAFASEDIPEGEYIDMVITRMNAGGMMGGDKTELAEFLNHQSKPNGRIEKVPSTNDQYYLKSTDSIPSGSEITMDYNDTPDFIAKPHQIDPEGYKDWN